MASLYELTEQQKALRAALLAEYEPDDPIVADTLEGESLELEQKIIACGYVISEITGESEFLGKEIKRLQALKAKKDKTIESLKNRVKQSMIDTALPPINAPHFNISVKGKAKALVVDKKAVPDAYWREETKTERVVDNDKIRNELLAGIVLNFAHFDDGKRLEIK